jgi:hypothetical protein
MPVEPEYPNQLMVHKKPSKFPQACLEEGINTYTQEE